MKILNWKLIILWIIILLAAILRFYRLDTDPPGLYWDEAVYGYDAYSILKTGKDHHGNFLPLFFESFGDWKLPVYHYLLVPTVKIFGLNDFAVRFPSASSGVLTVIIFFFLVQRMIKNANVALFCAFMLAISPWHIQFSRGGFESTAGLFFVVFGLYLFVTAIGKSNISIYRYVDILYLIFASLFFVLSMYSYHAYRIFTPLLLLALLTIYWPKIKDKIHKVLITAIFPVLLLIPLILFTISPQGRARVISQSSFRAEEVEASRIDYDQKSKKPLRFLSKYLYNKFTYYSYIAANGYIDHFSPIFLFFRGDQVGRHSQVDMGQIYVFDSVLIVISLFSLKKLDSKTSKTMLAWLLLSPIPATIVTQTPHAQRTLQMVMPLVFLSGFGAYHLFSQKKLKPVIFLLIPVFIYYFLSFVHLLFAHYPKKFAADWQDGYKQMVAKIERYEQNFDKIYITNINQVPYIYLLFYGKYDPQKFIEEKGTRDGFGKYFFISDDFDVYDKGRILYVAPSWKKVDGNWLAAVNDSAGRHIYSLWEINGQI